MENWPKDFKISAIFDTEEKGYTRIINAIIRSRDLSFGGKIVFSALLSHTFDFRQCYIKHATLAKECGCSVSTIKRYLKILKNKGVIRWKKAGFGRCNQYFINPIIGELIERVIQTEAPPNSTAGEPSIRPRATPQSDRRRTNEKKTTIRNKFKTSSYKKKKKVYENYDYPLRDSGLEAEAAYLAQRLKEGDLISKYRHVVKHYKASTIKKALDATIDLEASGELKKGLAAYFWGVLKSIAGKGDKELDS